MRQGTGSTRSRQRSEKEQGGHELLGSEAAQILVEASRGTELLVVGNRGNRGHGELTGMLLGSVREHCATHAHCPVLVKRSPSN